MEGSAKNWGGKLGPGWAGLGYDWRREVPVGARFSQYTYWPFGIHSDAAIICSIPFVRIRRQLLLSPNLRSTVAVLIGPSTLPFALVAGFAGSQSNPLVSGSSSSFSEILHLFFLGYLNFLWLDSGFLLGNYGVLFTGYVGFRVCRSWSKKNYTKRLLLFHCLQVVTTQNSIKAVNVFVVVEILKFVDIFTFLKFLVHSIRGLLSLSSLLLLLEEYFVVLWCDMYMGHNASVYFFWKLTCGRVVFAFVTIGEECTGDMARWSIHNVMWWD